MTDRFLVRGAMSYMAVALLCASLGGCGEVREDTPNAKRVFQAWSPHDNPAVEYVVDPPDDIVITAPNVKELDQKKQTVRPDGKITLNLLGEVKVSGKTPQQINDMLKEMISKYYTNPDIRVEVIANSKFYYISGLGSAIQGKKPFTGNDCVIRAVAEAGFNERAWPEQVLLVRPARPGQERAVAVIDFKQVFEYGDTTRNFLLKENDIITVRETRLDVFNRKFSLIVSPITGAGSVAGTTGAVVRPGGVP